MTPQEETLTPKQRAVCSAIIAVLVLSFSSVFVYAYVKGAQVQKRQAQAQAKLADPYAGVSSNELHKRATMIARGKRGQANNISFHEDGGSTPFWTISKLPTYNPSSTGLRPAVPIIAFSASQSAWRVDPVGIVSVPIDAELGLYTLRCQTGEYVFEVVKRRDASSRPKLIQTYSASRPVLSSDVARGIQKD